MNLKKVEAENQILQEKIKRLENDVILLKNEVMEQLNLREQDLANFSKELNQYKLDEKRYHSLKNSLLGRLTLKYWKVRRKFIKSKGATS